MDVNPRIEDYSALYLEKLPHNATKTSRMMHKTDLGEVSKSIHGGLDFVLPRVVATKDEIKNAGAAVFKGDKMVGWVGEIDSIYLKWIKDAVLGGIILIDSPNETGTLITLEITKAKVDVRPVIENDFIKMKLDVKGRFNLSEEMRTSPESVYDKDFIQELEKRVEIKLEKEMKETIEYIQNEFETDIVHFNVVMQRYAPDLWEKVKEDWDEVFPTIDVEITADAEIRLVGLMK